MVPEHEDGGDEKLLKLGTVVVNEHATRFEKSSGEEVRWAIRRIRQNAMSR